MEPTFYLRRSRVQRHESERNALSPACHMEERRFGDGGTHSFVRGSRCIVRVPGAGVTSKVVKRAVLTRRPEGSHGILRFVCFACKSMRNRMEVSHEYLYDPVCCSVASMAIRSWRFSCSGRVHSHPAHFCCNFAHPALRTRQA